MFRWLWTYGYFGQVKNCTFQDFVSFLSTGYAHPRCIPVISCNNLSRGANRHKVITSFTQTKVVTTSCKAMQPQKLSPMVTTGLLGTNGHFQAKLAWHWNSHIFTFITHTRRLCAKLTELKCSGVLDPVSGLAPFATTNVTLNGQVWVNYDIWTYRRRMGPLSKSLNSHPLSKWLPFPTLRLHQRMIKTKDKYVDSSDDDNEWMKAERYDRTDWQDSNNQRCRNSWL